MYIKIQRKLLFQYGINYHIAGVIMSLSTSIFILILTEIYEEKVFSFSIKKFAEVSIVILQNSDEVVCYKQF